MRRPPPRRGRTFDADAWLVLEVAAGMFNQNGCNATSIGDIAAGSGIAEPTLYHYFSSKTDILHELRSDDIESLISKAELPERADLPPAQDAPSGLRVGERHLVRQAMSLAGGSNEMPRNIISERLLQMPR